MKIGDFVLMREMYHELYEVKKQKEVLIKWIITRGDLRGDLYFQERRVCTIFKGLFTWRWGTTDANRKYFCSITYTARAAVTDFKTLVLRLKPEVQKREFEHS